MPGRLDSKIAVITGSSSGIGRAIALLYAREGATVVCSDIREEVRMPENEKLPGTTVEEITKLGGKAIYVHCDTTNSEQVQNLVKTAVKEFGRLDVMVNNAGIAAEASFPAPTPIYDYPESSFETSLSVNVRGVFLGTKYASLAMKDQSPFSDSGDRGWIINTASVLGLNGTPNTAGYSTSKHAVLGLTKASALDLAPLRIHVNAICPGYTATSFIGPVLANADARAKIDALHPFGGIGKVDDVARVALFLASEDAGWVTGTGVVVDGGYNAL